MAYQNVGTPRFYIDQIQYLKSIGFDFEKHYNNWYFTNENGYMYDGTYDPWFGEDGYRRTYLDNKELFNLSPEIQIKPFLLSGGGNRWWDIPYFGSKITGAGRYCAMLNHNMKSSNIDTFYFEVLNLDSGNNFNTAGGTEVGIVNSRASAGVDNEIQDGITIFELQEGQGNFNPLNDEKCFCRLVVYSESNDITDQFSLGALSTGIYYDMPHSPELDVAMTIENDGYDAITTQGGAHLTNVRYNGAPMWEKADGSEIPPWTIGEPTAAGRRRGRRVWSMNFKYLSEKDLFASNYMSSNYTENPDGYDSADLDTDADNNEVFYYNLDNDNSFHAQVLNKIGNGQRFIFQPDNTNNNPDQFAICQLDQDSLNIKQVANGVYDISLKIIEVW